MSSISPRRLRIAGASLLLLLAWALAARIVDREIILPTPGAAVGYAVALLGRADAWGAIASTLGRVLLSFAMNIVVSVILGVAAGFRRRLEDALVPVVAVMKSVPTMGVILLSLIWFDSETAVLFVCTLIVFPVLYSAVLSGVHHIDSSLMEMHRVFRIGRSKMLRRFVLPSLRPHLVAGLSAGLGLSMKVIIAAEVLAQPGSGIGTMFQVERARLNTVGVFAWSLLVILITAGVDYAFARLRRRYGSRG